MAVDDTAAQNHLAKTLAYRLIQGLCTCEVRKATRGDRPTNMTASIGFTNLFNLNASCNTEATSRHITREANPTQRAPHAQQAVTPGLLCIRTSSLSLIISFIQF
eukprot:3091880-Amphidinium_carterae.1